MYGYAKNVNYICCLGDGHLGQSCNHTRLCGINICKEVHHLLLHKDQSHQLMVKRRDSA